MPDRLTGHGQDACRCCARSVRSPGTMFRAVAAVAPQAVVGKQRRAAPAVCLLQPSAAQLDKHGRREHPLSSAKTQRLLNLMSAHDPHRTSSSPGESPKPCAQARPQPTCSQYPTSRTVQPPHTPAQGLSGVAPQPPPRPRERTRSRSSFRASSFSPHLVHGCPALAPPHRPLRPFRVEDWGLIRGL